MEALNIRKCRINKLRFRHVCSSMYQCWMKTFSKGTFINYNATFHYKEIVYTVLITIIKSFLKLQCDESEYSMNIYRELICQGHIHVIRTIYTIYTIWVAFVCLTCQKISKYLTNICKYIQVMYRIKYKYKYFIFAQPCLIAMSL